MKKQDLELHLKRAYCGERYTIGHITIEDDPGGFSGEQPVTSKVTITVPANPKPEARSFNLELVCITKPKMVTMGTFVLRQAAGA